MTYHARPPFIVYGLYDPRDHKIRYVGKTVNRISRYRAHTSPSARDRQLHVNKWLKILHNEGLKPSMVTIQECFSEENSFEAEVFWISFFRERGESLCNISNGGVGKSGHKKTKDQKLAIIKRLTGRSVSVESRHIMRESHMSFTPEQRAEIKALKPFYSYSVLGKKYGVSPGTIFNAVKDNYYPTQRYVKK